MTDSDLKNRFSQLARRLDPSSVFLRSWPLAGGLSAKMTVVEVRQPDGTNLKIVVRQPNATVLQHNPRAAAEEFETLRVLQTFGLPVPAPHLYDESGEIFPTIYYVLEYIDGQPDFAPLDCQEFIVQAATQLAAIHRLDGASPLLSFLPRQTDRITRILEGRREPLDDSLAEGTIRQVLGAARPIFLLNEPSLPVLLHGDFWPGNWLWRENKLVAVIDWEDAAVGNALADLAITRLEMLWTFSLEEMHTFTHLYQSKSKVSLSHLPYWDLWAALRPAGRLAEWVAGWPAFGRADVSEKVMRQKHRLFVKQALDQLAD